MSRNPFVLGIVVLACLVACSKRETPVAPAASASTTSLPANPIPFEHPRRFDDPKAEPASAPLERARSLYFAGDVAGARAILEPRVLGAGASDDEARFLTDICSEQKDQKCIDKVHQLHP